MASRWNSTKEYTACLQSPGRDARARTSARRRRDQVRRNRRSCSDHTRRSRATPGVGGATVWGRAEDDLRIPDVHPALHLEVDPAARTAAAKGLPAELRPRSRVSSMPGCWSRISTPLGADVAGRAADRGAITEAGMVGGLYVPVHVYAIGGPGSGRVVTIAHHPRRRRTRVDGRVRLIWKSLSSGARAEAPPRSGSSDGHHPDIRGSAEPVPHDSDSSPSCLD